LISVQSSRPIFRAEKYGLSSLVELAVKFSGKIAVLGESAALERATTINGCGDRAPPG
jgi:hypothetical protein